MARTRNEHEDVFGSLDQWRPQCHTQMVRRDGYFECPQCNFYITDEEVEETGGYPTLESTDEYEMYYPNPYNINEDEEYEAYEL